ncbi:MAG: 16S rRNA methyltransferase, partial [Chlamydiia bacterium]|nr:16S rRNA methyltransferase [Chlamydiia bacterium]
MLYLLPNVLDEEGNSAFLIPEAIKEVVAKLDGIIAESEKGGRKFLKAFHPDFRSVPIILLNEHTTSIDALLSPLQKGERWGLISDAGLPVLADPGAKLVRRLHTLNIPIETFPGPSSIVYALQLSGLPGQRFVFNGYPPRDEKQLLERLRTLPKGETHLFI